jgi:hypothetical protein
MVEDATFHDSDRDMAGMGTWHNKDRDAKAWQDGDQDRGGLGTRDIRENEIVLKNVQDVV